MLSNRCLAASSGASNQPDVVKLGVEVALNVPALDAHSGHARDRRLRLG